MPSFFTAQYYDKPDGEDYVGKMMASNRLAIQAATVACKSNHDFVELRLISFKLLPQPHSTL
jgi:aryl-alcohol dehydrogenase-like predicted oxidoreductase